MKIHTPLFLLNTSVDYFNIGKDRCNAIFSNQFQNDTSLYQKLSAPATILSFAVELLIKSILLSDIGSYDKTHFLDKLFNSLSEKDKSIISVFYEEDKSKYLPTFRFVITNAKQEKSKTHFESSLEEIVYKLGEHDNSFVHWRYIASFSIDSNDKVRHFDFGFMIRFYKAVFKRAKELIWPKNGT